MSSSDLRNSYRNFNTAIYARAYEVKEMANLDWLKRRFDAIDRYIKVDKVYLETHRDTLVVDEATLEQAKAFFHERGIRTSGGITYTIMERNRFQTYCYSRDEHRQKVQEIAEYTARHFDEMILDDFFFTNCKCPTCIAAKGDRTWTEYRLQLMAEAARDLIIGPAKAVNPDVTVIIKYPNWYEHFQGLGFNLEDEPPMFDKLYTGTETRDPVYSNQHLQPYESYNIFRYFEAIKPGANAGGWVDTGGMTYVDRYAEQLWLTLFAKAPEITLFDFRQMSRSVDAAMRAPWQDNVGEAPGVQFDFDAMMDEAKEADEGQPETTAAHVAGNALAMVDEVLGELSAPVGVPSYKPFHSTGEDFLHNYLGMLGIPIDLRPEFPADADTILLTEAAKADPAIVDKIMAQLMDGKTVIITSGLLKALQGTGAPGHRIEDIAELEVTDRKALVSDYLVGWRTVISGSDQILVPHIQYLTNDSWEIVSGLTETTGHPLLHMADYANSRLYVLTIPDNFDDLYHLPEEVLAHIRAIVMQDLNVRVNAPAQVMFFAYDNDTFIVESFRDETADVTLVIDSGFDGVQDVVTGETFSGTELTDWRDQPTGEKAYEVQVGPHAYRVFRCR